MPPDKLNDQRKFSSRFEVFKAQRKMNKNYNDLQDKLILRKIANRQSAAEFRKRTKDEALYLRQRVTQLEEENVRLKSLLNCMQSQLSKNDFNKYSDSEKISMTNTINVVTEPAKF